MQLLEFPELICRTTVSKRAPCMSVRHQYQFGGINDFCCLRHKIDPGKNNDIGIVFFCRTGKSKTVANNIGNLLNFRNRIIMSKNKSVHLFFKGIDPHEQLFMRIIALSSTV